MRCDNKTALVVGGAGGIGQAAASLFSAHGATVGVADLDQESAHKVAAGIDGATGHAVDVTSLASCCELISDFLSAHGRIDILASTVGWSDTTFLIDETEDYWKKIIAINLLGSINVCRAVMEPLIAQQSGSIVLTSSDAGRVGTMGETVYAAAKAGVIGFVKSFAREVARDHIRVNAISPGPTDTPLFRAQSGKHVLDKMVKAIPLKRIANPSEPASAIVFLGSDAASYITGQTLSVSGGLTMSA